jgi:hypothetical protein
MKQVALISAFLLLSFKNTLSFTVKRSFSPRSTLSGGNRIPPGSSFKLHVVGGDPVGNKSDELVNQVESANEQNPLIRQWNSLSVENKDDIKSTSVSLIVALLIRFFIIEPRFIPSLSMFPTFDIGDQLLVDKVTRFHSYQRRDVVVFQPSDTYTEKTGNK